MREPQHVVDMRGRLAELNDLASLKIERTEERREMWRLTEVLGHIDALAARVAALEAQLVAGMSVYRAADASKCLHNLYTDTSGTKCGKCWSMKP
ncbi:hypothetical protein [Gemmatimonas sp.]|uniref:hypothetical protein n=1 Tax=Gemmatimonas sp. TaxID=1962908 RepID=UPI0025C1779C|nr:hypothetical protein [Gemmatimonas sp.]MCA2990788.1 hypothetical protein [Gemmatimonas sp.]